MKLKLKISLFLSVLLVILGVSCSRPADKLLSEDVEVGSHVFTREQVINMLYTNGMPFISITLTDEFYIAPTANWIKTTYSDKLTKFLFDYNLNHWTRESSDCDDISRAAAVYSSILFHNSKNRPKGKGLLFGEFHYIKAGAGGHAINFAIAKSGDKYKLVFYEPQKKFEIELSEDEKSSVMWARF